MLEEIRDYQMDRCATNRTKVEDYNGSMRPRIKKRLQKKYKVLYV